jgi:pimeloyl-ACP methyl ester carboxylesterase
LRDLAIGLRLPVWVAWARSDRIIPLAICKPCIDKMRNATLPTFAGGHVAFLEQPEQFERGFVEFARQFTASTEAEQALVG